MTSDELRTAFLKFFEGKGHKILPSSSLIPQGDPTLLLTNAGMVQIKPYFLGEEVPPSPRLASCQKCFRTTDIELVGDSTHLTFFEMLGNFSVGDYFKQEAIAWAWEFVTQKLSLPAERLWITVFLDDDEAYENWRQIGVPEKRILRFGEEDNFWGPAGDSGPCGPCSEIFYDFGEEVGCGKPSCAPNCGCARFSEIWNLVFPQYNQDRDGVRTLLPKPSIDTGMGIERTTAAIQGKTNVYETGLFASLLSNISGIIGKNYGSDDEIDKAMRVVVEHGRALTFLIADGVYPDNEGRGYVLRRLLRRAALFGRRLGLDKPFLAEVVKTTIEQMGKVYPELVQRQNFLLRVIEQEEKKFEQNLDVGLNLINGIIDEARKSMVVNPSIQQAISEMARVSPALEQANKAMRNMVIPPSIQQVISEMARVSPALEQATKAMRNMTISPSIQQVISEMARISPALEQATKAMRNMTISPSIQQVISDMASVGPSLKQAVEATKALSRISGREAFQLYDTYGLPQELTQEIAAENGFSIDAEGFEQEMEKQRERAKASNRFEIAEKAGVTDKLDIKDTTFVGYSDLSKETTILSLLVDNEATRVVSQGQEAGLILADTPFYGEMGGQVGDTGEIRSTNGRFKVDDTVRIPPDIIVHQGHVIGGSLDVGDAVEAEVDKERRFDIARNHTATHLLQAALREVLGEHIQQRGSLVSPDQLRFDFSHLMAMTQEEVQQVNRIVNDKIRQNLAVYDEEIPYRQAIEEGAIALFDEKYSDTVRVLRIGRPPISAELCGGTHVNATGEIGFFRIISESSIGAGLRRIEAVTGRGAEEHIESIVRERQEIAKVVGASLGNLSEKVSSTASEFEIERQQRRALERELSRLRAESLIGQAETINGIRVLVSRVPSSRIEILREMSDLIRDKLKSVIVVLGTVNEDKPFFLAAVTDDLVSRGYNAGDIVKKVAEVAGGGGGGRATLAQAGGRDKDKLNEALKETIKYVKEKRSS